MGEESLLPDVGLPPIMTIAQAAKHTGLPELTVRRLAREGVIPALKLGRQWRIKRDLLEKWLGDRSPDELHPLRSLGAAD